MLAFFAFALGTGLLQLFSFLPPPKLIFTLLTLSFGAFVITCFFRSKTYLKISRVVFFFLLGFAWSVIYVQLILNWHLPSAFQDKNIFVKGYITTIPKIEPGRMSFTFATKEIADQKVSIKLLLSLYNAFANYSQFHVGDEWQFIVRLKKPHATQNPGCPDHEAYLLENHIRATGYIILNSQAKLLSNQFKNYPLQRMREKIFYSVKKILQNKPYSNLIMALIVGERDDVTQDEWKIFRETGTIHFMAIAGLHIGLLVSLIFFLVKIVTGFFPRIFLFIPANKIAAISALLAAATYSAMAGFSLPVLRAAIMLTLFMFSILWSRNLNAWQAYFTAVFVILFLNPLATLNSGFWLSFAAVAIIIYSFAGRRTFFTKKSWLILWLRKYFRIQLALTLGLMPLTLFFFQQCSLISLCANLIAIPWIGCIVLPASLIGTAFLFLPHTHLIAQSLLIFAEKAIGTIFCCLSFLAQIPFSNLNFAIPNFLVLSLALLGAAIIFLPRAMPARLIGIFYFLPLFFYRPAGPAFGEIWFTLVDVGQGLSAVMRTEKHVIIYDTGPKFGSDIDAGSSILTPFLRQIGQNKIDTLVVSHGDSDHIGGANSLIDAFLVQKIYTSVPERFVDPEANYCYAGQSWQFDGVTFSFLFPEKENFAEAKPFFSGNNASCLLKVSNGKQSILLTGDLEKQGEEFALNHHGDALPTTILIAAHHGSKTGSNENFVSKVNPKFVLFPVGYDNRFHFPHPDAVAVYQKNGAQLFDTANSGAITFKLGNNNARPKIELYRQSYRRYWLEK